MRKVGNIAPLSIYNRLRQFGEFYQDNMWSISASEASGVLEAFRTAYDLIAEEDRRTGINTLQCIWIFLTAGWMNITRL